MSTADSSDTDKSSAPEVNATAKAVPDPTDTEHPAGEQQAAENAENESAG